MSKTAKLYLGFDASCGDCSRIARRISDEAGQRVSVVSLRSSEMRTWRKSTLGESAPWAPTLVVERGEKVEAWTGWQIAPVLARYLDATSAMRILGALGGDALSGTPWKHRLARRSLLRGAAGAVVGLGLLSRAGSAAAGPSNKDATFASQRSDGRELSGPDLVSAAERVLASPDVANVVGGSLLTAPHSSARASSPAEIPPGAILQSTEVTGKVGTADGGLEVFAVDHTLGNGVTERTVVCYQHEQGSLVVHTERSAAVDGLLGRAYHLHVEVDGRGELSSMTNVAQSINGDVPTAVDLSGDALQLADDPCGGCKLSCGPGNPCKEKRLTEQCNWSATWQCVAGGVGCALCTTCSGWFVCITCALSACPAAVDACCSSASQVCATCVYPT